MFQVFLMIIYIELFVCSLAIYVSPVLQYLLKIVSIIIYLLIICKVLKIKYNIHVKQIR